MTADRPAVGVVIEFPLRDLPTGVARRAEHLLSALEDAGARVEMLVLETKRTRAGSGVRRRLRAARRAPEVLREVDPDLPLVVIGLGTPTMAVAARRLVRTGRSVVLDECDGVLLQLRERLRSGRPRIVVIALWHLALHLTAPSRLAFSYISRRDARADSSADPGRRHEVFVVPPNAPRALGGLPPVRYPATRIVAPVELASHHTRRGFRMLLDAVALRRPAVPVQLYGPTAPTDPLPAPMTYEGYAARLADVYAGDTVVVVTNVGGSGVPNKLVEAAAAGRPAVVHRSLAERWPVGADVFAFDDAPGLSDALERAVRGPAPRADAGGQDDGGDLDGLFEFLGVTRRSSRAAA